jgi:hypothetical protein
VLLRPAHLVRLRHRSCRRARTWPNRPLYIVALGVEFDELRHCLVAWPKVTRPTKLGGLGISHLQTLGWALRMRWLWLQKTEPHRPWAAFPIQVHPSVKAFFSMAVISEVGNGKNMFFWTDKWLHGQSLALLVPHLFRVVYKRAKKRTVFEALTDMKWISDVRGASTVLSCLNTSTYGIYFQISYCSQRSRTHITGNYLLQENTLQSLHMRGCSLVQVSSVLGKEYGRIGHLASVNSSCGWLPITNVGQLIASPRGGCLTRNTVHSVAKLRRQSTIC